MRQIAENYKTGEVTLVDVPVPSCRPGGVVVRSEFSLVSAGTELMKVAEGKMSLLGKARARPDQVRRVLDSVSQQGVGATYRKVMNRLDSYTPLGYSLAGTVVESMVPELPVGSRVACGGNEYALHAEFNYVPRNLCALVPDGVKSEHAAFTTVGAIAMQAFRRSEATIGETVCVIGLGLIGQLVVQIAHAAGVNVFGLDPSEERCALAERVGARAAGAPTEPSASRVRDRMLEVTDGQGADVVFLAAATDSDQPVNMAVDLARDKARIVDIGKLPLDLPWKPYYEKEIDVRFSRSYGPGRYDPTYEEDGVDYPIGYVRWTEQRNMKSFLDLVADERIDLESVIDEVIPFDSSVEAYERLLSGESRAIGSLFAYRQEALVQRVIDVGRPADVAAKPGMVAVGVVGSGNYATTMLLPHLAFNPDVRLSVVATATALSGATAQERFGFDRITSDYTTLIDDEAVDAVVVATRHDLHAEMVSQFISAGKSVFVEKPLALNMEELERVVESIRSSDNARLMVGFNRRFSPLFGELKDAWGEGRGEQHLHYLVNAGPLDRDSWYRDLSRYGSRFVGEGGHFVDVLSWWLGEEPIEVTAASFSRRGGRYRGGIALSGRLDRAHLVSDPGKPPVSQGDVHGLGWVGNGAARQLQRSLGVVGPGEGLPSFEAESGQGAGGPSGRLRRGGEDRVSDADPDRDVVVHDRGHPVGAGQRDVGSGRAHPTVAGHLNLSWYAHRLATMGPGEILHRARDAAVRLGTGWEEARLRGAGARRADGGFATPFAREPEPPSAPCRDDLMTGAEDLSQGRLPVFGVERSDMGESPDWFLDPKTGLRAPAEDRAFGIRHRSWPGSLKHVWEPSRHQHLTVLAAAARLSRDTEPARLVMAQLESWWRANPPFRGIHWTSGIEIGMRLISWVWIRRLLAFHDEAESWFEGNPRFLDQLFAHQVWLSRFPSHGTSANNHAIAEAAGLFSATCAFPLFAESSRWMERAGRALVGEARRQVDGDGVHRELATDYHGFVTELFMLAGLEGEAAGAGLGVGYWQLVRSMVDVVAAMLDSAGRPPRQGDSDDAFGLLVDGPGFDRWASILTTGDTMFGGADWWPVPRVTGDMRSSVLSALAPVAPLPQGRPLAIPVSFPESGITILRARMGGGHELWCRCDAGPLGYMATAAHGHDDALSIELRHDGVDLLADPGTYCYQLEPGWRSYFRSIRAHNTLQLANARHARQTGPFIWSATETSVFDVLADPVRWTGRCTRPYVDGGEIEHTRTVTLHDAAITVEDAVDRPTKSVLRFHLGPSVDCVLDGHVARLTWPSSDGGLHQADMALSDAMRWRVVRGETDEMLGWYSPSFDVRVPSITLEGEGEIGPGRALETEVIFEVPHAAPVQRP